MLRVSQTVADAAAILGITDWRISVSHDAGIAAAVVVALGSARTDKGRMGP